MAQMASLQKHALHDQVLFPQDVPKIIFIDADQAAARAYF